MSGIANVVSGTVGSVEAFFKEQMSQRIVQVSVYSGIVFYILSTYELIDYVEGLLKKVGVKAGKDGTRAVHAVIFAAFMYLGTRYLLDPLLNRVKSVEGLKNKGGAKRQAAKRPVAKRPVAKKPIGRKPVKRAVRKN